LGHLGRRARPICRLRCGARLATIAGAAGAADADLFGRGDLWRSRRDPDPPFRRPRSIALPRASSSARSRPRLKRFSPWFASNGTAMFFHTGRSASARSALEEADLGGNAAGDDDWRRRCEEFSRATVTRRLGGRVRLGSQWRARRLYRECRWDRRAPRDRCRFRRAGRSHSGRIRLGARLCSNPIHSEAGLLVATTGAYDEPEVRKSAAREATRARRSSTEHTNSRKFGGGRGIRTPGTLPGSVVFKTTAIDHSAIPPRRQSGQISRTSRATRSDHPSSVTVSVTVTTARDRRDVQITERASRSRRHHRRRRVSRRIRYRGV
jgi:hypothetical protein